MKKPQDMGDKAVVLHVRNSVLFLSGHGDMPMVFEDLEKGTFDFLEKPYSDNTLVDRIERASAVGGGNLCERCTGIGTQGSISQPE